MPKPIQRIASNEQIEYVKNEVDLKLDRVNSLWMKLEHKLLSEQPPRRIACKYESTSCGEDGEVEESHYLGIQRHHAKWRICYARDYDGKEVSDLPWRPIVECDMETRVHATQGIEDLKSEVERTRTSYIPALDQAIDVLENALTGKD